MKAITIWQPWASLIALGEKKFETRSWHTKHRGPIAIHAGQSTKALHLALLQEPFTSVLEGAGLVTELGAQMPLGALVAIARLTRVIGIDNNAERRQIRAAGAEHEMAFGDYRFGRWAWQLDDVYRLPAPIPVRGMPGLWDWSPPASVRARTSEMEAEP